MLESTCASAQAPVAALACHRHAIHSRSRSTPPSRESPGLSKAEPGALVEVRGVEPLSERTLAQLSPTARGSFINTARRKA